MMGLDSSFGVHVQLAIFSKNGERKRSHDVIIKECLESGLHDGYALNRPVKA